MDPYLNQIGSDQRNKGIYQFRRALCTISTSAQYNINMPRERTYMKIYFVANSQAGPELYLG